MSISKHTNKLVKFIQDHGMKAFALNDNFISVMDIEWETIPADTESVLNWLQY